MINKEIFMIHAKFSWPEVFSNTKSGKTSASAVSGVITIFVGLLCFIAGVVNYYVYGTDGGAYDIILQSLGLVVMGSSLLGVRKFKDSTPKIISNTQDNQEQKQ
jgi:hypothetical protein